MNFNYVVGVLLILISLITLYIVNGVNKKMDELSEPDDATPSELQAVISRKALLMMAKQNAAINRGMMKMNHTSFGGLMQKAAQNEIDAKKRYERLFVDIRHIRHMLGGKTI